MILYDYAEAKHDEQLGGPTEVVSRQRVFSPVVEQYLKRIQYGGDGWAIRLVSPATERQVVVADPERSFGQPIFSHGGVRVEDVLDRWRAGESLAEVAEDFGVPSEDVEDILRVNPPRSRLSSSSTGASVATASRKLSASLAGPFGRITRPMANVMSKCPTSSGSSCAGSMICPSSLRTGGSVIDPPRSTRYAACL